MYRRMIKKIALVMVFIIPIGYFSFFLFIGPAFNDAKAVSIEKEFSENPLPPETETVETASYCGNTGGTGNHVEIWAGALIRSKLTTEEISQFYRDYEIVWAVPLDENIYPEPRDYMKFQYLSTNGNRENCYIIAGHYTALTQCDIRGH